MTSAQFAETPLSREPAVDHDHDSEHASDHELSANDDSPPSKITRKRTHDDSDKDEPETKSAREDLRHTRISDREKSKSPKLENNSTHVVQDKEMEDPVPVDTPEPQSPRDQEMKDRSSPKKKRPRDKDDDEVEEGIPTTTADGEKSVNGSTVNGGSALPMKKRHRDASQDSQKNSTEPKEPIVTTSPTVESLTTTKASESSERAASPTKDLPSTSPSAFANSGFASLASAPSPFTTVAASKPSVFGASAAPKLSGFGALSSPQKENTALSGFGTLTSNKATGFGSSTTGGFGGLTGGFGGGFGSNFSSGFGAGPRLTSFAAPPEKADTVDTNSKPAAKKEKAFGAPESSEDEGSEDEGSDAEAGAGADDEEDQPVVEEKKKTKAPRAPILDGEEDEITLCQVRAKLFEMNEGWKERGVGALKINIPRSNGAKLKVDFDDYEDEEQLIIPATKEGEEEKSGEEEKEGDTKAPVKNSYTARLVMRQESTHRVILNSVVLKDQHFQEKSLNNAVGVIFMAFEEGRPVNMMFKMSAANAREFLREIEEVKTKL